MQRTRRNLIAGLLVAAMVVAIPVTAQARDEDPYPWRGNWKTDTLHNGLNDVPGSGVWNDPTSFGATTHGCTYRQGWCGIFRNPDSGNWHVRPAL